MSKFLHVDDNDDTIAIAIPRVFSENSRTNKLFASREEQPRASILQY